uniref:Uncharacterized protein n=1 Tax=Arundo donax TaxID=35708 RepID=A0A0A9EGT4_ARUDO
MLSETNYGKLRTIYNLQGSSSRQSTSAEICSVIHQCRNMFSDPHNPWKKYGLIPLKKPTVPTVKWKFTIFKRNNMILTAWNGT